VLSFLFWNINGKSLESLIADLVQEHEVDVLLLAECKIPPVSVLETLNRQEASFHLPRTNCRKISIFTRFPRRFTVPTFESSSISIVRFLLPQRPEILLAAVHMPSKLRWRDDSQAQECTALSRTIQEQETKVGHRRTILVGDLNMNPFEAGIVSAGGLNAVMTKRIAAREERTVQGKQYPYFYNPMWGHFGDRYSEQAGMYHYDRAEHVNYRWNIFDQVLLRSELAGLLPTDQPRILTRAGKQSLVASSGVPDGKTASDHLPVLCKIDI
jgi:exonuclease III